MQEGQAVPLGHICLRYTYSAHSRDSQDTVFLSELFLQLRELSGVKRNWLTNKASATERKSDIVRGEHFSDCLELLVQLLFHGRVSTISTDEDVTMVRGVVREFEHDIVFILSERKNALAKDIIIRSLGRLLKRRS